jgi:hypothetical protein
MPLAITLRYAAAAAFAACRIAPFRQPYFHDRFSPLLSLPFFRLLTLIPLRFR